MRHRHAPLTILALAILALGPAATGCTNKLTPPGPPPVVLKKAVTPDSVQSIFTANCALSNCHLGPNAQEGQRLEEGFSYQSIVGVPSNQVPSLFRIEPGNAADSYLVRKIDGGPGILGQQMPRGAPPLPASVRDVIRNWANAGAPADSVAVAPSPFSAD